MKLSDEHKRRIGEASKGRISAEKNPNWSGEFAGYGGLHEYVKRRKLKSEFCEICGLKTMKLELSCKNDYTRNPEDYHWLCIPCHRRKDYHKPKKPTLKGYRFISKEDEKKWENTDG